MKSFDLEPLTLQQIKTYYWFIYKRKGRALLVHNSVLVNVETTTCVSSRCNRLCPFCFPVSIYNECHLRASKSAYTISQFISYMI